MSPKLPATAKIDRQQKKTKTTEPKISTEPKSYYFQ